MVRKAIRTARADDWPELLRRDELNPWTWVKLQGCYYEVRQDEDQRRSIVQKIMQNSTDFLRRIIVPVQGQGGVTLSYVCPHCHRFPREAYIWRVSMKHRKTV